MKVEKENLFVLYICDSDTDTHKVICQLEHDYARPVVETVVSLQAFLTQIKMTQYDVILVSYSHKSSTAKRILELAQSISPHVPILFITDENTVGLKVELFELGASDIICSNGLEMLSFSIKRCLEQAEQRRAEIFYHEAQKIAHFGNWEWDLVHDLCFWSEGMFRLLGYQPRTCIPKISLFLEAIQDKDAFLKALRSALNGKQPFEIEHTIICPTCKRVAITQGYINYDESDIPMRIIGTTRDITEYKRIENQALKSKMDLEEMQQIAHIGSWNRNLESGKLFWSDELYRLFGFAPKSFIPSFQSFLESVHPDDRKYIEDTINDSIISKESFCMEFRIIKGLEVRCVKANGKSYYNWQGCLSVAGIIQDITTLKKAEEDAKSHLMIQAKSKSLTEFFTNISHEFKTPLSIILMQLELMRMYLDDEKKMQALIETATQNSFSLARLVGNILDISRLDAGFTEAKWVYTDIIALVREICDSVDLYAMTKSIQLSFSSNLITKFMPTDIDKIERILLNLLSNAIKNTETGGAIVVRVNERKEGGVVISVEDNGAGIPKDKQKLIFERFTRVNTSPDRENDGCGIGLALVKSFVEILKGEITVRSDLGKGSVFTVVLPFIKIGPDTKVIDIRSFNLKKRTEMELSDLFIRK